MKKMLYVALIAVLTTLAGGCQKEDLLKLQEVQNETMSQDIVKYYVDGEMFQTIVRSDSDWEELMEKMLTLTEYGHEVFILGDSNANLISGSKDMETHTTKDKKDATNWTKEKRQEGYNVGMTYDSEEGEYTCIATNDDNHQNLGDSNNPGGNAQNPGGNN